MNGYVLGGLYFMIWSEDEAELYFTPEAVIFIGMNLDDPGDRGDQWFFQDARSYCGLGAYPKMRKSKKSEKAKLYVLKAPELHQIADSANLATLLAEHAARRAAMGIVDQLPG